MSELKRSIQRDDGSYKGFLEVHGGRYHLNLPAKQEINSIPDVADFRSVNLMPLEELRAQQTLLFKAPEIQTAANIEKDSLSPRAVIELLTPLMPEMRHAEKMANIDLANDTELRV